MAINQEELVDFAFKKLGFGTAKTDTAANKAGANETIASALPVYGHQIWSAADQIPATPPANDTALVKRHNMVACTQDGTATPLKTWKIGLTDLIPPTFGPEYIAEVYIGQNGARIFPGTTGEEYFVDYQAGVIHFIGGIPTSARTGPSGSVTLAANGLWVNVCQYAGPKGIASVLPVSGSDLVTYAGVSVSSGVAILPGFFTHAPKTGLEVFFNGLDITAAVVSSGLDLHLNIDAIGYALDPGDRISARYWY